ncbi:MAG: hypothetical protein RLZZ450_6485 [Pseudomonadota bacterium]
MRRIAFVIALCLTCLAVTPVHARKQQELAYRYDQIWNAALRLVKVDLRMPISDKDQAGGYVLFEYVAHGKSYPGSIELVAQPGGVRPVTVVIVQVQGQPSYVEQMILDRLGKKLQAEVGEPPEPPKAPKPVEPEQDAGSSEPAPPPTKPD